MSYLIIYLVIGLGWSFLFRVENDRFALFAWPQNLFILFLWPLVLCLLLPRVKIVRKGEKVLWQRKTKR